MCYIDYHHSFLLLQLEHRASIKCLHPSLSAIIVFTLFKIFPTFRASLLTLLFHVFHGHSIFLAPYGFQLRASFSIVPSDFLRVYPIPPHFLIYIYNPCRILRTYLILTILLSDKRNIVWVEVFHVLWVQKGSDFTFELNILNFVLVEIFLFFHILYKCKKSHFLF